MVIKKIKIFRRMVIIARFLRERRRVSASVINTDVRQE